MPRLDLTSTVVAVALSAASLAAQSAVIGDDFYFDETTPLPASVRALEECGTSGQAHRKRFAGGFVFALQCAGNNENYVETLIYAKTEDGTGARLLRFPGPAGRRAGFEDTLSNIRWYADQNEIGEIAVDREAPRICRSEGRWRLEGKEPTPQLVFWRETKDCEGRRGWVVIVGKK